MIAAELLLVTLVVVAALVWLSRVLRVSYPIVLLVGGLGLGLLPGIPRVELDPDIVFLLILPPILYVTAFFTPVRDFRAALPNIASLAVGLVLASAVVVAGVAIALVPGITFPVAVALGAIVSPPDEVAAAAILERMNVPRRVVTILEGESLLNDATALTLLRGALAAAGALAIPAFTNVATFVVAVVGGVAVGFAVGWLVVEVRRRVNDLPVEITISLLTPYAAYLPAQLFGFSGVLAAVFCGLYVGRRGSVIMGSDVRLAGRAVWEMLIFLLNGIVFILIGVEIATITTGMDRARLLELGGVGLVISAVLIAVRALWLFGMTLRDYLFRNGRRLRSHVGKPIVLTWAGMRGVVSLAAALALPLSLPDGSPFPARDALIVITFTVILVTLVGQGLTLPAVIKAVHLGADEDTAHEEAHARTKLVQQATRRIEELYAVWPTHRPLLDQLMTSYRHRLEHSEEHHEAPGSDAETELVEHRQIRRSVIDAEREALGRLRDEGAIDDDVYRTIERDLDLEEVRMEA